MPPTVGRASGKSDDPDHEEDIAGKEEKEVVSLKQRTCTRSMSCQGLSSRVQNGSSSSPSSLSRSSRSKSKKKKSLSSAVMEVTKFDATTVVTGEFPKSETVPTKAGTAAAGASTKKRAAGKRRKSSSTNKYSSRTPDGGAPTPKGSSHRKAATTRPWKWFACQDCVSCLRTFDCGKCGQCRRSDVMATCILRQCITPARKDVLTPKRVIMSDDDESLEAMDSDLSDLEWEEAFPVAQFGVLTPEELWRRWNPDTVTTCADTDDDATPSFQTSNVTI